MTDTATQLPSQDREQKQIFTNETNIPLLLAVFLARDSYDYDPHAISSTQLIRPIRQLVLKERVDTEGRYIDIAGLIKSRFGTALHDGVEKAWRSDHVRLMQMLGYPRSIAQRIQINPDPENMPIDCIPIYIEQRFKRKIIVDGVTYTISGKPDFIADGAVQDIKSTTTVTHKLADKDDDYILQCSIYRWLVPGIITNPKLQINFMFTDWFAGRAKTDKTYPQSACAKLNLELLSLRETEAYIVKKLRAVAALKDAPEQTIPFCNDKELWRKEPAFKYWAKQQSFLEGKRCTKNFEADSAAAHARVAEKGGIVKEFPGAVVACRYCPAFEACTQKDEYLQNGLLTID